MKVLKTAVEELFGLFVEDGTLAIGILIWIAVAAFIFPAIPGFAAFRPYALFGGLIVLLLENVWRSAKRHFANQKKS